MSDTSKGGFWAPVCDLGKHLLDKLEKLGHYVISPKGTMPEALETYITRIKEEHLPPLVEAYAIANAKKDIKEMANKRSIIQYALARLSEIPQPTPSEVVTPEQEEWFSRFFDSARHISDEEIQIIWGRILAEETAYPNSIPKSLFTLYPSLTKNLQLLLQECAVISSMSAMMIFLCATL